MQKALHINSNRQLQETLTDRFRELQPTTSGASNRQLRAALNRLFRRSSTICSSACVVVPAAWRGIRSPAGEGPGSYALEPRFAGSSDLMSTVDGHRASGWVSGFDRLVWAGC